MTIDDELTEEFGPERALTKHPMVSPAVLLEHLALTGDDGSLRTVAKRLGVDPAIMCRPWSLSQADRYATRLGLHAGHVWGADWYRPDRHDLADAEG